MTIIERYIFRRILVVAVAALAVTTGMALTTQVLIRVNLLTSSGQSMLTIGKLAMLLIPEMLIVSMPFALLIGVLQTLRAMNQDSELAVLEASGSSIAGRAKPALAAALIGCLCVGTLSIWVEPAASRQIREMIGKAAGDLLSSAIQSGGFKQVGEGLILQIAEKLPGGEFGGIFVSDSRDPENEITYVAKTGALVKEGERNLLVVRDGEIQRKNPKDQSITFIRFDVYSLDASTFTGASKPTLMPRDRTTAYLLNPDPNDATYQSAPGTFARELNKRFSDPLYPLAMVLVGLFFTVNARSNRQEAGMALAVAALTGFGLKALGFVLVARSSDSQVFSALAYAAPIGTALVFGALLMRGARGDAMAVMLSRLANAADALRGRLRLPGRPA